LGAGRWFGVHAWSLRHWRWDNLPRGLGLFDRKPVVLTSLFHDKNTGITSLKPQAFCRI
jgi:hypothetical protein